MRRSLRPRCAAGPKCQLTVTNTNSILSNTCINQQLHKMTVLS